MSAGAYSTCEIRMRAVGALTHGMSVADVASAYRVDRTTLFRWRQRYDSAGETGLHPASAFGFETDLWTVRRVHQVLCREYDAVISRDTVWRRLREAGLTYQRPE